MATRYIVLVLLGILCKLELDNFACAQTIEGIEPCFAMPVSRSHGLPAGIPVIQSMGHSFRNTDGCEPVYVTFIWSNYYDRGDGYTHYSLNFKQTFPGEFWYRRDRKVFVITANPLHFKGISPVKEFSGYGQRCDDIKDNGACSELVTFDKGHIRAIPFLGKYLSSLGYMYPAVTTTQGQEVPETFDAKSPEFEFANGNHQWHPDGGILEINNAALASMDYADIVKAASEGEVYATSIVYDQNNDLQDIPSGHKGILTIKLDFDLKCGGRNERDMPLCEQIENLIPYLKEMILWRDLYNEALPDFNADDIFDIDKVVIDQMKPFYPYMTSQQVDEMLKAAGITNSGDLKVVVPDNCDECTARPACEWINDFVMQHEKSHVNYLKANKHERRLLFEHGYQDRHFPDKKKLDCALFDIAAYMETLAYSTRAQYVYEKINELLKKSAACKFTPQFYADLDELKDEVLKQLPRRDNCKAVFHY